MPGSDAEHTGLGAGGATAPAAEARNTGSDSRGRRRPDAATRHARPAPRSGTPAVHVRNAERHAGFVHRVARREIVGAVDHDLLPGKQFSSVRSIEAHRDARNLDAGIEAAQGGGPGVDLQLPSVSIAMQDLSLQVAARLRGRRRPASGGRTPAAARYSAAGEPSPPAPTSRTRPASNFRCPSSPISAAPARAQTVSDRDRHPFAAVSSANLGVASDRARRRRTRRTLSPSSASRRAADIERAPLAHNSNSLWRRSGARSAMRGSRSQRGTCVAPCAVPASSSEGSRTVSIRSAPRVTSSSASRRA